MSQLILISLLPALRNEAGAAAIPCGSATLLNRKFRDTALFLGVYHVRFISPFSPGRSFDGTPNRKLRTKRLSLDNFPVVTTGITQRTCMYMELPVFFLLGFCLWGVSSSFFLSFFSDRGTVRVNSVFARVKPE